MIPNFFIVGAMKAGTTSMWKYLNQHPDIFMSMPKEPNYFAVGDFPKYFNGPGDDALNFGAIRDFSRYEELFSAAHNKKIVGESSVYYLYYPGVCSRIKSVSPNAKILIMLRHPIDRAYSAYMHLIRDGRETLGFYEALQAEDVRKQHDYDPIWLYKEVGLYYEQVKRYFDVFGREQVKIVFFDDFELNTQMVVNDVLHFLGLSEVQIDTSVRYNSSGLPRFPRLYNILDERNYLKDLIKPLIPEETREKWRNAFRSMMLRKPDSIDQKLRSELTSFFAEDTAKLGRLIGKNVVWD